MGRDFVSVGRLGAPKGIRGDLKLQSYSGESAHFRELKEVELMAGGYAVSKGPTPKTLRLKIARIEGEGSFLTIAFDGYTSPEMSRALTGMEMVVPRSGAAPLGPNEWYIDDLVGLTLVANGRQAAVVTCVLEGGAEPWLEALVPADAGLAASDSSSRGSRTAIVPFRKEFVGEVDIDGGTIELLVPELLDE